MADMAVFDQIARIVIFLETHLPGTKATFNAAIAIDGKQANAFITANAPEHTQRKHKVYLRRTALFVGIDAYGDSVLKHYDFVLFDESKGRGFLFGSQGLAFGAEYKTPGRHNINVIVLNAIPIGCEYQGDIETCLAVFAVYIAMLVKNREYNLFSFNCQKLAHAVLYDLFGADMPIQSCAQIVSKFMRCKLLKFPGIAANLAAQAMCPRNSRPEVLFTC